MRKVTFKESCADSFISQKMPSGRFDSCEKDEKAPFWYVISVVDLHEAVGELDEDGEKNPRWLVSLDVVAPDLLDEKQVEDVLKSIGDSEKWETLDELVKVEYSRGYGYSATVLHETGNSLNALKKKARNKANEMEAFTFGFVMDRHMNALGATGWDFLKGNILSVLG